MKGANQVKKKGEKGGGIEASIEQLRHIQDPLHIKINNYKRGVQTAQNISRGNQARSMLQNKSIFTHPNKGGGVHNLSNSLTSEQKIIS